MLKKNKLYITLSVGTLVMLSMQNANAQLSGEQQAALDKYNTMHSLPISERRSFRQQLFANMTEAERDEFKRNVDIALSQSNTSTVKSSSNSKANRIPGTSITYDDGVGTGAFVGLSSNMFGNRFDTGNAFDVETSGSITQITFDMVPGAGTDNVFYSVFSNIVGTAANVVTSVSIPSNPGLNVFTPATAVNYSNGPFLAGIWQIAGDTLQPSLGSVGGQGFHGVGINDIAGTGYNPTITSGSNPVNAIFRVTGDIVSSNVPVELIDFSIKKSD
jgi:hypothetical protein